MRHTPDKVGIRREPVIKPCPEDKANELTDILANLENLKYATHESIREAQGLFMEIYVPLFVRGYDVKQYYDRYKAIKEGRI